MYRITFRAISLRSGSFILSIKITNGIISSIRKIVIRVAQFSFTFIDCYRESVIAFLCLCIFSIILVYWYPTTEIPEIFTALIFLS
jgi:hypothetical protein